MSNSPTSKQCLSSSIQLSRHHSLHNRAKIQLKQQAFHSKNYQILTPISAQGLTTLTRISLYALKIFRGSLNTQITSWNKITISLQIYHIFTTKYEFNTKIQETLTGM